MSKKRLIPGGDSYHHVTVRTAQGVFWLEETEVKKIFEDVVADYAEIYYVEVLAQSCMSNHVHIILKMSHPRSQR